MSFLEAILYMIFFFDSTKIGYWYLWVLSIFYLLLSLLPFYIEKTHVRTLQELIYGLLVGGLFLIIKLFSPNYISDFISADQCFGLWFCFFFGFMSRRYSILDKNIKKRGGVCFIILLLLYMFAFILCNRDKKTLYACLYNIYPSLYSFF